MHPPAGPTGYWITGYTTTQMHVATNGLFSLCLDFPEPGPAYLECLLILLMSLGLAD